IKSFGFDEIEIVDASTSRKKLREFRTLINEFKNGKNITKIESANYEGSIVVGFDIVEIYNTYNLRSTRHSLRRAEIELIRMNRQKERLEKDIAHIENSTSWKVTSPVRMLKNK